MAGYALERSALSLRQATLTTASPVCIAHESDSAAHREHEEDEKPHQRTTPPTRWPFCSRRSVPSTARQRVPRGAQ